MRAPFLYLFRNYCNPKARHPDVRKASARSHQRASRTEGSCVRLSQILQRFLNAIIADHFSGSAEKFRARPKEISLRIQVSVPSGLMTNRRVVKMRYEFLLVALAARMPAGVLG